ncbi:MAG: hypothetical protein GX075_11430 [Firmicutes bacterium]|nr:hypothetical protein [Bacillota bacterium]
MKKLLVLALAMVLTFSLAVAASAANLDHYVGGRVQLNYISDDDDTNDVLTYGNSGLKLKIQGTVSDEATGTWATIGVVASGWPDSTTDVGAPKGDQSDKDKVTLQTAVSGTHYDFGIKNINGSNLSIWFTNWENENMKRGQPQVYSILPNQYHDDPMFNRTLGYGLGFDYVTDALKVNIGYDPNENDNDANNLIAAVTFNFDGGEFHLGSFDDGAETEINVGGSYKLGFGTVKLDYVAKEKEADNIDGSIIQAAVFFDDLKFDVTLISDSKYKYKTDGGTGYQIRYTGLADGKVTIGYRAMNAKDDADAVGTPDGASFKLDGNFTDIFIGYKFGIFETRIGSASTGDGDSKNDYTYLSAYASLW